MSASPIHRLTLENGITLLVVENTAVELVAGRIFLKNAGTRWEKTEKAGLFRLLAVLLTKGTEKLSSLEIADRVESTAQTPNPKPLVLKKNLKLYLLNLILPPWYIRY